MLAGRAGRLCGCLKHPYTGSPYAHLSSDSKADACETWAGSASSSSTAAGEVAGEAVLPDTECLILPTVLQLRGDAFTWAA